VAEEVDEEDDDSSLLEGETTVDGSAPSSSAHLLKGKVREPLPSDSEEEVEEEEVEARAHTPVAPKRQRYTIRKSSAKKAKMAPVLVQTKLTSSVKPAPSKATPSKSAQAPELDDIVMLSG
jgi:hypothetical protein